MSEIIGGFAGGKVTGERADPAAQARDCPLTGVSQMGLQLAERHLDRIQVGGIFGQIAKRRTARFDCLANTGGLVRWKISPILAPEPSALATFKAASGAGRREAAYRRSWPLSATVANQKFDLRP